MTRFPRHAYLGLTAAVGGFTLLALLPRPAAAQTAVMFHDRKYLNPGNPAFPDPNNIAHVLFDNTFSGGPGSLRQEYIGAEIINLVGTGVPIGPFDGYCVDLPGDLGTTQYDVSLQSMTTLSTGNPAAPGNALRGNAMAWLYNHSVVTSDTDSAALQLALWKVEYDWDGTSFATLAAVPSLSLAAGNLRLVDIPFAAPPANPGDPTIQDIITNQTAAYLLAWGGQTNSDAILLHYTVPPLPAPQTVRQDIMINFSAPEPGSLPLLAASLPALGGLAVVARRRRRTA